MAKRKAWQRALSGLGEGIGNASQLLLRQQMLDQQNERILSRQKALDDQNYVETLLQKAAEGVDPDQIKAMARARGISIPSTLLDSSRPTVRKRLSGVLDAPLAAAKTPEDVYGDEQIASLAKSVGAIDPNQPPAFMTEGMEPQSGAMAGLAPEAVEYAQNFATKRRMLENAPTQKITGKNAQGQDFTQMVSLKDLQQPFTTSPTATQQGVIEGEKEKGKIATSGQAEAEQAGRVATATTSASEAVKNNPANVNARVNEARAKKRAELQEELAQSGMTPQQQSAALQLSDDFYNQSKEYFDVSQRFRNIATMAQRIREARQTGGESQASHIGLVFNFMKLQDPGSTVREGEYATAANAAGVDDRMRNLYNSVIKKGFLTPEQVTDFTNSAAQIYQSTKADHARRINDFTQRATQYRVPPALVVREPDPALDTLGETDAARKLRQRGGQQ